MLNWLRKAFGAAQTQTGCSERLSHLEEQLSDLQHERKSIVFEWNEMYEKFNTLHARLSKRAKRDDDNNGGGRELTQGELLARARARHGNPFGR